MSLMFAHTVHAYYNSETQLTPPVPASKVEITGIQDTSNDVTCLGHARWHTHAHLLLDAATASIHQSIILEQVQSRLGVLVAPLHHTVEVV